VAVPALAGTMITDDEPSATDLARPAMPSLTEAGLRASGRTGSQPGRRTRLAASRGRPWWKWMLIWLLLAFSLTITTLYAVALIGDIARHHWADALDTSRDAVPAGVGWAALLILFFGRSSGAARLLSGDTCALGERVRQAARDQESVDSATCKVQRLTAKLARLAAARDRPDPAGESGSDVGVVYLDPGAPYLDRDDADLEREIAETTARLDQARQWLASARAAVVVSQRAVADAEDRLEVDFPELARQPDPGASKPA
jgi:hypothetical protein